MIQDNNYYDEKNEAMGRYAYYMELNGAEHSCIGGIKKILFNSERLKVEFDENGKKAMSESMLEIQYKLSEEQYHHINKHLKKVFENNKGDSDVIYFTS